MQYLLRLIKLFLLKRKWRINNKDNETYPRDLFPINVVEVGRFTYGGLKVLTFGDENKLKIGDFCSIGPDVTFVLKADHPIVNLTTFPVKVKILGEEYEAISKGDIVLEDDVWIGCNSIILSGVTIGKGSVVAAGSVVTRSIPPYAVVGGNPAKIIKYRFSQNVIEKLVEFDFKTIGIDKVHEYYNLFYKEITNDNIDVILDSLRHGGTENNESQ